MPILVVLRGNTLGSSFIRSSFLDLWESFENTNFDSELLVQKQST